MKKSIVLTSLLVLTLTLSAQIPTNGLVGYWPFNGNANDESGNGYNGTVFGAILTTDRFGNANRAYSFNGVDDYVATNYSGIIGTNQRTISVWLKRKLPNTQNMYCLAYGGNAIDRGNTFRCGFNFSNVVGVDIDVSNGNILYASAFYDSSWHHYSWVVPDIADPKLTDVQIYEDGKLLTDVINYAYDKDWCENTLINTEELYKLLIGDFYDDEHSIHFFFSGDIDDIRIYDTALNYSEIQSLFNEGKCIETVYDTVPVYDTIRVSVEDTLNIDVTITGINPPDNKNEVKVYPNPTRDQVCINTGDYAKMNNYQLKIINGQSQEIWQTIVSQELYTIDINTFGALGLYFLQIFDENSNLIEIRKIVLY